MNRNPSASRRQSGFTLVELMVGVLVGLIATIVMFQVFAVSESQKRTTTGAGDAQQNGVATLFQLERDARMAGFGLNYTPLLGCRTFGWHNPSNSLISFALAPATIVDGAGGTPDSITFIYGNSNQFVVPEKIRTVKTAAYTLKGRFGFNPGDIVVVGQVGQNCTMSQVSAVPTTPVADAADIKLDVGTYVDENGNAQQLDYNRAGGLPAPNNVVYSTWDDAAMTGGRVFNLGRTPTVVSYSIQGNQLVAVDGMVPGAQVVLSDGIVQMQAQYGFDGDGNGQFNPPAAAASVPVINTAVASDQWGDAMPAAAAAADWAKVMVVRIAVVARSITPERVNPATGVCEATTANPVWLAKNPGLGGTPIDVTADPNWQCYRYRLFEVTVPLRNVLWFATPA